MHLIVMTFRGADIKVEVANFCAAMDTLIDQDELPIEMLHFLLHAELEMAKLEREAIFIQIRI